MVLPVHNGARWLAAALDSVLAQSFADFELICVDDASSDGSPAILADYAARDPRISVRRCAANVGLPAALNHGFAAARGALHSWTSDDNLLRPDMLARLVAALDANPDAGVAHSDYQVIDDDGAAQGRVSVGPVDRLLLGNNIGASFLYRAEVTAALGGYGAHLFGAEDYDFWLRAAARFRFVTLAEDLYLYRKHGGSLTNQRAAQIQALVSDVVLAALAERQLGAADQADVLVSLVLRNSIRWRGDLWGRALAVAPARAALATPRVLRHWLWLIGRKLAGRS